MRRYLYGALSLLSVFIMTSVLSGCDKKESKQESMGSMKCGAGKCGINMMDGNSLLIKKKVNILSQMRLSCKC